MHIAHACIDDMHKIGSTSPVTMASTALSIITLYLLMTLGSRFAVESSFQESNIVPDVISTAPPIAAEVSEINR